MTYTYKAKCVKVIDGDTVDLIVDMGFYMSARIRFRVLGVDTPELRGGTDETKQAAKAAKRFVEEHLIENMADSEQFPLQIYTEKADSFGRWLAQIWVPGELGLYDSLGELLIKAGLATRRPGAGAANLTALPRRRAASTEYKR